MSKRIIVFAGVFDPIHLGHISAVTTALAVHTNATAVVVAEKTPQHKHGATAYQHRFEMLKIAFKSNPRVEVLEAPISEHKVKPFFIWLQNRFDDASFSWMVGSDVLIHMHLWPDIEKLKDYYVDEILSFDRKDYEARQIKRIGDTKVEHRNVDDAYITLSSKLLREQSGKRHEFLLPAVLDYIKEFNLY